ncbi:hypothetical protein ACFOUP_12720 [Belliella kenyensis]|uniref:Uncharacterized protein n=1 Tax=Belliella kenyensis TaxID=1472724 RepID=A0ABV8EQ03_9BACT|nr:hypothetical protein [Belliella kenyensis]MCH7400837.1 hypothetical protein [Belliella kenyensis]MDN3601875.1 hypothetical protein [Belliella kenyensis]
MIKSKSTQAHINSIKFSFIKWKKSLILVFTILMSISCSQEELLDVDNKVKEENVYTLRTEYEKKLEILSLIFGEIFLQEAARKEFLATAELNLKGGQAELNLKKLFDADLNLRKYSSIAQTLQKGNLKTLRMYGETEDWITFIQANDIKIIAPYLAENFKLKDIKELTVSWWTEEMEIPYLEDPNWEGETPGYKINLEKDDLFEQITVNPNNSFKKVTANDEYAKVNPTIVLGNFEMPEESDYSYINSESSRWSPPSKNPIRCSDLTAGALFTLRSPKFNLTKNTRGWPNTNYIYMWVVTGDVEYESNGFPKPSSKVEVIYNKKQVYRSQVPNAWIDGNSFLIQNWKYNSDDIAVIWGYFDRNSKMKFTGEVNTSDKDKASGGLKAEYEIDEGDKRLMSRQNFDKCALLENNFWSDDQGHGFIWETLDVMVAIHYFPVYKMGDIKFYYTTTIHREL